MKITQRVVIVFALVGIECVAVTGYLAGQEGLHLSTLQQMAPDAENDGQQGIPESTRQIWVASRRDGRSGAGTAVDPYDASSAEKLATLINSAHPNTTVHFARGNYNVSSLSGKPGLRLRGAGKNVTKFLWNGANVNNAMIYSYGGANGMEVSDLTLNGQQSLRGRTPMAIMIYDSSNVKLRNIRATNFKGGPSEAFLLTQFAQFTSVSGALIEDCEVDHFVAGSGGATLLGFGHGGSGSDANRISGKVLNNYVHDCPDVQAIQGGGTNSLYQGNLVVGSSVAWSHDTWSISNNQIANNRFLRCRHYGIVEKSDASGKDDAGNSCDDLLVANNMISLDPAITTEMIGVWISGAHVTNVRVSGNTVVKTNISASQQYGLVLATGHGLSASHNQISNSLTNVINGRVRAR